MTGRPSSASTDAPDALLVVDCGRIDYEQGLALQADVVARRATDDTGDTLLVLEHDPVYSAGRHADVAEHVLDARGIPVVRVDRGGDVTYHGPGQVVIYPILRLTGPRRVRAYVTALEQACIAVAAAHGIGARTVADRPGVWVGDDKLAAIGVRVRREATSHGLAFNVATDLDDFAGIVPCGIRDGGVCSLASLGVDATVAGTARHLVAALAATLDRRVGAWSTAAALGLDDRRAA
jgi:lipoyl(octanoyl) transferase